MKVILLFVAGVVAWVYTAFVSMCLWNWFVPRATPASTLSLLEMVAIMWLARLVIGTNNGTPVESATGRLEVILKHVVPDAARAAYAEAVAAYDDTVDWAHGVGEVVGTLLWNTAALAGGFVIHQFVVG